MPGAETDPLIGIQKQTNNESTKSATNHPSIASDAWTTLRMAVPIFLAMLSWVGMKTTDSALLGHVSVQALAAASLSDLWTMCTVVLIQARVLGFLCSAAIGAGNPKLAGTYLQISYVVLGGVCVLVFIAWYFTENVWKLMGSDPTLAHWAGYYARVLAFSLPGQLGFAQLAQFFSSQRILYPEMNAATAALVINLVLGLVLVLGVPIPGWNGFGFAACPVVTCSAVYIQLFIMWYVYIFRQKLHRNCWGGWSWTEITLARIRVFADLWWPAAGGMASDFYRVALIGTIAARLGTVEVSVFNTSYRIMWIVLIMVSALTSAAGIMLSQRLGSRNPVGARQVGYVGLGLSAAVLVVVGLMLVSNIHLFGRIFTNDPEFLALLNEVRLPFTITLVLMNLSVAIERIPYAMGRTREVFWYGFIASWGAQVPAVYVFVTYWKNDLARLYWGMAIGYAVLAGLYGYITFTSDWNAFAEHARDRAEAPSD